MFPFKNCLVVISTDSGDQPFAPLPTKEATKGDEDKNKGATHDGLSKTQEKQKGDTLEQI